MFDVLIRNGMIVDGTGAPGRRGSVAVSDGRIVGVGAVDGPAAETIDAKGGLITPGFIDIHTHYDGQFLWDDRLEPSFSNGVTTAVGGNCGVGFAPVRQGDRTKLIELMEGVEDIPGIVLDEGLDWDWESFPDYLDRLGARAYTMDVATQIGHAPLRVYAMGERALAHEKATDEDIARMAELTREAMNAGAVGVSGSRILEHRSSKGDHVFGTFAEDREVLALARAMGETGKGVFQIVPLGESGDAGGTPASQEERRREHARFEDIARVSGRPVTYLLHQFAHDREDWHRMIAATERAREEGLDIQPQVAARGVGILLPLEGYHIFRCRPSYLEIAHLPRAERAAAMREPARRAAILSEPNVCAAEDPASRSQYENAAQLSAGSATPERLLALAEHYTKVLHEFYIMRAPGDYEPQDSARLTTVAAEAGKTLEEAAYDLYAEGDGSNLLVNFILNYADGNLDAVGEMLAHPLTVSGLGDGGAHLQMICDASMTTYHLAYWARDRGRGTLPLELMVHKITGKPAELYGFGDRGIIEVGRRADLNVIDFDRLGNGLPYMAFDLPHGSARLLQQSRGYIATLVNGVVTRRDDQETGARPGRLHRLN
ncbi:N-acyl-D-amino-acid deacylase family protein [Sphingomonas sp.]|uniref:N-acyl-D-amino-acid deacylase family protein n=1 Tax=Sphingomonas sp. TaxID=28214 RepID=UPI003AFFD444